MKMRLRYLLIVSAALLLTPVARAADLATSKTHWYGIWINSGGSSDAITGSSPLDAEAMAAQVQGNTPIKLENLRSWGEEDNEWKSSEAIEGAEKGTKAVYILPRAILYFYEYSADPVSLKKIVR